MQVREKVGTSRNAVFFQWFVAPGGRQVGSLKPRVRSHLARWEMKNCTPLWREAHFGTFPSQNVKNTRGLDHFWKLRCRKSARRCGAKHISKSKCTKYHMFRAPASSFFWLFSDSLFSSLIFSDPSHLCFFICLIVGSLTSKFRRFLCVCVIVYVVKHVYVMMIMLMYLSYTILYIFFSVDMHIHVYMSSYIFLSWTISSKLAQPKQRRVFSVFLMLQANWWAPAAGFANCLYLREPQCFGIQGLDHLTSCD